VGDEKPNPLSDAVRGLGLLFRAAKTVAQKLPTKDLEEVVATSAREVGRAFESVASRIEREVLGKKAEPPPPPPPDDANAGGANGPKPPDGERR